MTGPPAEATPTRRLLGRGSIYTLGLAAQLSAGLLTLPVVTRLLDSGEFGIVASAAVVRQILATIVALGLPSAITRFAFDGEDGPARSQALLASVLVASVAGAAVADLTGPLWANVFGDLGYDAPLRIATWSTVPFVAVFAAQAMLRARDRAAWFVAVSATATVGAQALGIGALVAFERTAAYYLGGLGVGFAIAAGLGLVLYPPTRRGLTDRRLLRAALAYGAPTVLHGVGIYVLAAGDRVIVERLEGLGAVGRYQVAYLIGGLGVALIGALNNAWAPLVFSLSDRERWPALADTSLAVFRLGALVAGGLAIAAPLGLAVAAPAAYDPSDLVPVVAIVAASVLPLAWYVSHVHIVFQVGRTGVLAWATPVAAAINIGLNFALIPVWDLEGAAVATLVSYTVQAFLVQAAAHRIATVPWHVRGTLVSVGVGAVLVAIGALAPGDGWWLVPRAIAGVALAAAVVYAAVTMARRR